MSTFASPGLKHEGTLLILNGSLLHQLSVTAHQMEGSYIGGVQMLASSSAIYSTLIILRTSQRFASGINKSMKITLNDLK